MHRDGGKFDSEVRCIGLDRTLWFTLVRSMWKQHRSVFDEHEIYVNNDTQNTYKMGILNYYEQVRKIFDLYRYLPPTTRNNED